MAMDITIYGIYEYQIVKKPAILCQKAQEKKLRRLRKELFLLLPGMFSFHC